MSAPEPGRQRRKSTLTEEALWTVPAKPDTQPPPAAPSAGQPPAVPVQPAPPRRRARDLKEARGRKLARDAAYGWAAAEARLIERHQELAAELAAARGRGTDPEMLLEFLAEARARHGLDPAMLPPDLIAEIKRTP
ncbi:hypothetical protein REK76_29395 (plasmid) [Nocardia farcinica]|uniref:hypothetical protein n=1 Tax=Nocardia farcinica TaxID=37329 RepID=UPI0018943333|nr:hypothetical protein [Nocardia farcinica]MBF6284502.1 hypothetical protein [Nocardia farcinica]